jgi:hypothetical protein
MRIPVRRLVRLAVGVALGLVTLEVTARVDDWIRFGADPVAYYGPKNLVTTDDQGLTCNRPNVRYEKWRHDGRGFRVYPETLRNVAGSRCICVGSSESYGLYEKPAGEWPAVLNGLLAADGVSVENASVVGISPFELPWYLEQHVLPGDPDRVLLIISPFSFIYGMGISGAAPDSAHFADPARLERMRVARAPVLREQSRFLPKAQRSILRRLPPDWTRRLAIATKERKLARLQRTGNRPAVLLDVPPPEAMAAYVNLLSRLRHRLAVRGVEMGVCTYPNSLSDEPTLAQRDAVLDRTLWLPSYSPIGLRAIADSFAAATRAFCDTSGVVLVDFEAAIPHDSEDFADSVHLTDTGARRAAEIAADALRRRP